MKYGLLYFKETANIGDDIQTYAAKRFLPRVDYLVDRESLNCFVPDEKEYVSVIMNAWYMYNKFAWPPSPYINPLLISMHFTQDDTYDIGDLYLSGEAAEYLNKYGPVGARDDSTKNMLSKNNINTFFSGCMTLTLNKFDDIKKQDYICLVDVGEDVIQKIKENTNKEIKTITHNRNAEEMKNKTIEDRMSDVEEQLKEYQAASLIITDRLHVALPGLALETPVILLRDKDRGKDRIKTFEKFVTHYQIDKFLESDIKNIINEPQKNGSEYLEIRNNLIKLCTDFIKKSESVVDINDLPDINDYKKNINNIKWHNSLYFAFKEKLEKSVEKNYNDVKEIWESTKKERENLEHLLNNKEKEIQNNEFEIKKLQSEIEKLRLELESIYNSRTWKIRERIKGKNKRN